MSDERREAAWKAACEPYGEDVTSHDRHFFDAAYAAASSEHSEPDLECKVCGEQPTRDCGGALVETHRGDCPTLAAEHPEQSVEPGEKESNTTTSVEHPEPRRYSAEPDGREAVSGADLAQAIDGVPHEPREHPGDG